MPHRLKPSSWLGSRPAIAAPSSSEQTIPTSRNGNPISRMIERRLLFQMKVWRPTLPIGAL